MKSIYKSITATFLSLSIISCQSEQNENTTDKSNEEPQKVEHQETELSPEQQASLDIANGLHKGVVESDEVGFTPLEAYKDLITFDKLAQTVSSMYPHLLTNGEPDFSTEMKVCYFTPPYNKNEYAYAQANFKEGDKQETAFFLCYIANDNDQFSNVVIAAEEIQYPCDNCQLLNIEVRGEEVFGIFYEKGGSPSSSFEKEMEYDLVEMNVYWK